MPDHYREEFNTLIQKENGRVIPRWEEINKLRSGRDGSPHGGLYHATIRALVDVGVLSLREKGTYGLMVGGMLAGPLFSNMIVCYFTEREEAERYEQVVLANAQYDVRTFRFE